MGCACSREKEEEKKRDPLVCDDDSCSLADYRKDGRWSYDSGELSRTPARGGASKVPETSSFLGRAGLAGLGKAMEVIDTLGSSMSSLNHGNGFISGVATRVNKISILAFEVANTIVKGATILMSLSAENIQALKDEILQSDGVRQLIPVDTKELKELLFLVSADKREELEIFSREVIRFGDLCKDPIWHNLGRYFQRLDSDLIQQQSKDDIETTVHQLMDLAQNTSELYHELHVLDRFEQDYQRKLQEEKMIPAARRESLMIIQSEVKHQRKLIRSLKKKSLWSRALEEVVEKLVDVVIYLHKAIIEAFGNTDTTFVDNGPNDKQTLGVSGLALHYANIIHQIDTIVCRPFAVPANTRETLYQGLPPAVKMALRYRLQSFDANEECAAAQIKSDLQRTLKWIVPVAENTIRLYQGFGWVGEWANISTEVNKQPSPQHNVSRIQTLYHADKEKTEEYILELVVLLHRLVIQVKNKGYGLKVINPVCGGSQNGTRPPDETNRDPSRTINIKTIHMVQLSQEDLEMLESTSSKRMILARSKSYQDPETLKKKRNQRSIISTRSCDNSPAREFNVALNSHIAPTNVLDVMDGLETL